MNIVKKSFFIAATAASLGMAGMMTANAASFAESILEISGFKLLKSTGVAFSTTDFGTLTGTNDAHATASLNNVFANGLLSVPINAGPVNVPAQCVGVCPGALTGFLPYAPAPLPAGPAPGTFGYADENLSGSSITVGATPAGALAQTRADASLNSNGVASGNSDVGTSTTFKFTLAPGAAGTMTVAFDARAFTSAYVSSGSAPFTNANARLSWSINIVDLTAGGTVLAYAPIEINALSNVSRTEGLSGTTTYAFTSLPGTLTATTGVALNSTDIYQLTIQHNTLANALVQVPEPATLAIFGIGLLGMSLVSRRKNI